MVLKEVVPCLPDTACSRWAQEVALGHLSLNNLRSSPQRRSCKTYMLATTSLKNSNSEETRITSSSKHPPRKDNIYTNSWQTAQPLKWYIIAWLDREMEVWKTIIRCRQPTIAKTQTRKSMSRKGRWCITSGYWPKKMRKIRLSNTRYSKTLALVGTTKTQSKRYITFRKE